MESKLPAAAYPWEIVRHFLHLWEYNGQLAYGLRRCCWQTRATFCLTLTVLYLNVDGQCDKLVTDNCHQFITLTVHLPRVGPGQSPFPPYPFSFPLSTLSYPFRLSYSLYLFFFCFSIPFHSTRILPLCFQAGCHRRRLNLALVFCVHFMLCIFLVKDACSFLSYLIYFCFPVWWLSSPVVGASVII